MRAVSQEVAYAMTWKTLRQMMTAEYCPRGEIKKLEVELWNLKDLEKRNHMEEPNLCALDETSTMMDHSTTKGSLTILQGTNKTNNHSEGTTMLHGPMLQDLEKRNHTEEPKPLSQAANTNNNNNNNNRRATTAYQGVPTCFECGAQGHFKNNCPKLGNKNQGNRNQGNQNQTRNENAVARAYGVGTVEGNPNANVVT
nr:reverse transcriptase domain-containing protein [Tanacetum cinerariifolium]